MQYVDNCERSIRFRSETVKCQSQQISVDGCNLYNPSMSRIGRYTRLLRHRVCSLNINIVSKKFRMRSFQIN